MISTFRERWLEQYFLHDQHSKKIPSDIDERLFRKLQFIDDAMSEADLRVPPGNHYEKLKGGLEGWSSIRINQQWRLIFLWDETLSEAKEIYLDNHTYR